MAWTGELQKILISLLGKVHMPVDADEPRIFKMRVVLDCVKEVRFYPWIAFASLTF
jgi:hypothetical protein